MVKTVGLLAVGVYLSVQISLSRDNLNLDFEPTYRMERQVIKWSNHPVYKAGLIAARF